MPRPVGPVARETAATLLWPEADEETARARLRRTLYKIRVAFRSELVAASGTSLSLHPALSVEVDSKTFEHACDRGPLEMATNTYTSDFLAGFSLPDCQEFEEWAFFRREALRSRLTQALERLIETQVAAGEARTAVVHATRLVGLDPLSESAHRHLIRANLWRPAIGRQPSASSKHAPGTCGKSLA